MNSTLPAGALTRFQSLEPSARLSDRVADALAAEIQAERLAPGDRLPTESALSAQFSVSRTVVREAVSRLKSLGMVEPRQGSGVYVRAAGIPPLAFDGQTLRLTRRSPEGVQLVAWALHGKRWQRWVSPPVVTVNITPALGGGEGG